MQKNVRDTLGDDEQKTLYTKMANEVRITLTIITIIIIIKQTSLGPIGFNARFSIKIIQFT